MKTHNQNYFYKHVTANVAKNILDSLEVRCSSPLIFNDPFDSQIPINIGPAPAEEQVINILNYLQYHKDKQDILKSFTKFEATKINSLIKIYNEKIYKLNREDRVFCVSEKKDSLLMWSHYTNNHSGAVIKFKCLPERASGLCGAKKVKYSTSMPKLTLLDFLIDGYIDDKHIQKIIINDILLTKSIEWEYEQEWRVILFPRKDKSLLPDEEQYDDIGIFEQEIDSIYLGYKMKPEDSQDIINIVKGKRNGIKVFKADKDYNEFKLNFNQIVLENDLQKLTKSKNTTT